MSRDEKLDAADTLVVRAGEHLQIVREQIGQMPCAAQMQNITIEENASVSYIEVILPTVWNTDASPRGRSPKQSRVAIDPPALTSAMEQDNTTFRSAFTVRLAGDKASFKSDVAYMASSEGGTGAVIDIDHTVHHFSPDTHCLMHVAGSIAPSAKKMYRGTIDFHKGCKGSKGNETEDVLMLTPQSGKEKRPVNRSLPIILCDEEDVEGEHGSTIGRLDESVLFYCQSRGVSEGEAAKMICRAKLERVAALIEDERERQRVQGKIDKWFEQLLSNQLVGE